MFFLRGDDENKYAEKGDGIFLAFILEWLVNIL